MTAQQTIFISCVSGEFGSYRGKLRAELSGTQRDVKVQEDFYLGGGSLLEKLDNYISSCSAVVHLIGEDPGSRARSAEVRTILKRYPTLPRIFDEPVNDFEAVATTFSYTQWEAYLAILHKIPCYVYIADVGSEREPGWQSKPAGRESQSLHLQRLKCLGKDRIAVPFADPRDITVSFLQSLLEVEQERSWPQSRNHLPPLPANYVVREAYLTKFEELLDAAPEKKFRIQRSSVCLVSSLSGMPGVGKTILAIAVANRLKPRFPDGQLYINLNGFSESQSPLRPDIALDELLRQYGIPSEHMPAGFNEKRTMWFELLAEFRGIVILDNARNTEQIDALISQNAKALFIITSRNKMPELINAHKFDVDILDNKEARDLFLSYMQVNLSSPEELQALDYCVSQCGRLPLAIRIVASIWASRANSFTSVAEWFRKSKADNWIFRSADSNAEFTFRASYVLLSDDAQLLLRIASTLPGRDFTANRLLFCLDREDSPMETIFELVDYSLFLEPAAGRYSMHDLVRLYGRRRLLEDGPEEAKNIAYLSLKYFIMSVEKHCDSFEADNSNSTLFASFLSSDVENIVSTCEECAQYQPDSALRLVGLAAPYCNKYGLNAGAYALQLVGLNILKGCNDLHRLSVAHQQLANTLMNIGDFQNAEAHFSAAQEGAFHLSDDCLMAKIRLEKAFCFERLGKYNEGIHLLDSAGVYFRNQGKFEELYNIENVRGAIFWRLHRYEEALKCFYGETMSVEDPGIVSNIEINYNNIGFTFYRLKRYDLARKHLLKAYRSARSLGEVNSMLVSHVNLGYVYAVSRRPDLGVRVATAASRIAEQIGNRFQHGRALDALGDGFESCGNREQALEVWSRAAGLFRACNAPEIQEVLQKINKS